MAQSAGEFGNLQVNELADAPSNVDFTIKKKISDWKHVPTIGHAWELVNSAYLNHEHEIGKEAARYLQAHLKHIAPQLRKVVYEVLGESDEPQFPGIRNIPFEGLYNEVQMEMRNVKNRLKYYLRNDLLWLELGRLYSILGELKKAEQAVNISIYFSNKRSRYFLRTASRFFYHIGKYDVAQSVIRLSPALKSDPWLVSADISYSNKMGRNPVNLKPALAMIESKNYSNAAISELAGVLATMEFHSKEFKKARKFTRQSLLAPNDNSLAQAEWLSQSVADISVAPWIDKVTLGFEARSFEYLHAKEYSKSLEEATNWLLDQPFSKRASHFVSFLCTGLMSKYDLAVEVGELGRRSNPNYFPILNNLAFAYISKGDFVNGEKMLEELIRSANGTEEKIFAMATTGFYYFRTNDVITGKEFYQRAIEWSQRANLPNMKELAEAHYLREISLAGQLPSHVAISAIENLKRVDKEQRKHLIDTLKLAARHS